MTISEDNLTEKGKRNVKAMAKNNEKQKEIQAEQEPEMLINPKAEEMCQYEERNYAKCKDCPRTLDDQAFCKLNTIGWRLGQIDKSIQALIQFLREKQ
jgi:hypothetical protein